MLVDRDVLVTLLDLCELHLGDDPPTLPPTREQLHRAKRAVRDLEQLHALQRVTRHDRSA